MTIDELYTIILDRKKSSARHSYVRSLFREGKDRIIQKFGEEAIETIVAAKGRDRKRMTGELADLWFHLLILMADLDISPQEVSSELGRRRSLIRQGYGASKRE